MNDDAGLSSWQEVANGLSEANLRALIDGEVPAIRMPGFATPEECRQFCGAIRAVAAAGKQAQTAQMTLLGANFSNYVGHDKEGYFESVGPSYALTAQVAEAAGFDPLARMMQQLRACWPAIVDVAEEPGYGRYFAGGIKTRVTSGHLHYDFTPHTARGFAIAGVIDQLGWNLYLDMPAGTGQTVTYRRPVPRDGGARGGGAARVLNLDETYVAGAESFTFMPEVGEVVIINTRNPHDIIVENVPEGEWRAQTSSFIGRLTDDRLILWS